VRSIVQEALVLPLRHPNALKVITHGTRATTAALTPPRPSALLFHGPPGTGKTSAARMA
jgi:SpoVK/Ycf46/Vps4 family AAA+-type ATPase